MIKVGITSQLDEVEGNPIVTQQSIGYLNHLPAMGFDLYLFDWPKLGEKGMVDRAFHVGEGFVDDISLSDRVDILLIRQLGSLYSKPKEFANFLTNLGDARCLAINDPGKMEANLDKNYLVDLAVEGFPVIPTLIIEGKPTRADLMKTKFGVPYQDIVLKPRFFGEGGHDVKRLSEFKDESDYVKYLASTHGGVVAQPFMDAIYDGEASLFWFGNRFSHAVLKTTTNDDFRINDSFGSQVTAYSPTPKELDLAASVIKHYGDEDQMTRVDIFPNHGNLRITEVERINPATYADMIDSQRFVTENLARFVREQYKKL